MKGLLWNALSFKAVVFTMFDLARLLDTIGDRYSAQIDQIPHWQHNLLVEITLFSPSLRKEILDLLRIAND